MSAVVVGFQDVTELQDLADAKERFVRIAFANVSDDKIPAVLERLERFGA